MRSFPSCMCVACRCVLTECRSRRWLTSEGSPGSRIESAEVDEKEATEGVKAQYTSFEVRRG